MEAREAEAHRWGLGGGKGQREKERDNERQGIPDAHINMFNGNQRQWKCDIDTKCIHHDYLTPDTTDALKPSHRPPSPHSRHHWPTIRPLCLQTHRKTHTSHCRTTRQDSFLLKQQWIQDMRSLDVSFLPTQCVVHDQRTTTCGDSYQSVEENGEREPEKYSTSDFD